MSSEAIAVNGKCTVPAAGTKALSKFGLTLISGLKLKGNALKKAFASSHELFVIATS